MSAMKTWLARRLLLSASLAATVFSAVPECTGAESFALKPVWSLSPGSRPYLTATDTLQRGVAYNPVTAHVILVSRSTSTTLQRISVLNAADGADVGQLATNGISGGTFILSKIGVAEDGVIYAANFGTYSASNPFKVYRWANESAVPTLAFSGDPGKGNNQQWGNALAVRGTGANTQILLASRGTILALLTTSNGTNFSSTVLATDTPAGAFYHGLAFGAGDTFWGKTNSGPLRWMQFNRNTGTATALRTFPDAEFPAAIGPIAVDPVNQLLAGVAIETPDTLRFFDIAAPTNPPVPLAVFESPTDHPNTLFQGALDFYCGGKLFALNANNGLAAFEVVPPSRLRISPVGAQVKVAWPERFNQALVQSSGMQAGPHFWTNRLATPQVQHGELQVTLSRTAGAELFRLQRTFRALSYNIHHGEGTDGVLDLERIAAVIRQSGADVVGLQEVDQNTTRSGGVDQAAELARLTGMHHYFGKNINYQGGAYGNAVLSRFPIRQQRHTLLARLNPLLEQRGLNELVVDLGGVEVVLFNTHLDHNADDAERLHSIQQLKTRSQAYATRPLLICGDFNARPDSAPYQALTADFVDAWPGVGEGNGYTFSSANPNRRIDYFWHRPGELLPVRASVLRSFGSDHLPVLVEWLAPAP